MARHGQSAWQVHGERAGADAPLTALGELQAHRLGAYLAQETDVEALVSSNLQRALTTAEIVATYLDLPVKVDEDLREFDDWDAGWAPDPVSMWDASPADETLMPGYRRFTDRVTAALQRVVEDAPSRGSLLIIAHGGTIGTIWRVLLGSHTPRLWAWNAALHAAEWGRSDWGTNWVFHYFNLMEYLPPFMRTS
ncbi:MAG: histidine phosphatase family protein [Anaerolineae bacterium]